MPEFILDVGSPDAAKTFAQLDSFTQGYIEAMFFTSTGTGDDAENDLEHATVAELAPEALHDIVADCKQFQESRREDIDQATDDGRINGYDDAAAGRDFWYSRNGYGVGYRDRGLGDIGETLHAAASRWRSRDMYRGSDGLIYLG